MIMIKGFKSIKKNHINFVIFLNLYTFAVRLWINDFDIDNKELRNEERYTSKKL